jgi:uroporphyrinogen III methyltransferase/synthase
VDWEAVARVGGTIVVLMGVARIAQIAARLIAGGRSPDTPVASITWGTRPEQTTIRATLGTIGAQSLRAPATIVIGEVAAQNLAWFEQRPLFGTSVVVSRSREQSSQLKNRLHALGASVVELPAIVIDEPSDGGRALRAAAADVRSYEWVVLTSANGARRFLDCLHDARDLGGVKVAAIGPGTAERVAAANIRADLVPTRFVAESLLDEFPAPGPTGTKRVLLARAAVARDVLPDGLRERGWHVDVVEAYRTRAAAPDAATLEAARHADIITFTSSSTVERYLEMAGPDAMPPIVACIGPVTAATARAHNLSVSVEASVHSIDGLVDALLAHLASVR